MTWFEANDLLRYWAKHPPLHILVAAYMGVKPESTKPKNATGALIEAVKALGGSISRG